MLPLIQVSVTSALMNQVFPLSESSVQMMLLADSLLETQVFTLTNLMHLESPISGAFSMHPLPCSVLVNGP